MNKATRNEKAKYLKTKDAMNYFNLGRAKLTEISKESGAFLKVGRSVLHDVSKIENYLSVVCTEK